MRAEIKDFVTKEIRFCKKGIDGTGFFVVNRDDAWYQVCYITTEKERGNPKCAHIDMNQKDAYALKGFICDLENGQEYFRRLTTPNKAAQEGNYRTDNVRETIDRWDYRLLIKTEEDKEAAIKIVHKLAELVIEQEANIAPRRKINKSTERLIVTNRP